MARKFKYRYSVDTGTFTLTGNVLNIGRGLTADTGAFVLTGNDADLHKNVTPALEAETGVFTLTGNAASLSASPLLETGSFTLTGSDATFSVTTTPSLAAETGSFFLTGNDADLDADVVLNHYDLDPVVGEFTLSGSAVDFIQDIFIPNGNCQIAFQSGAFQGGAFQDCRVHLDPPPHESDNVGARISGGYFSRKRWHEIKTEIEEERRRLGLRLIPERKDEDEADEPPAEKEPDWRLPPVPRVPEGLRLGGISAANFARTADVQSAVERAVRDKVKKSSEASRLDEERALTVIFETLLRD